MSSGVQQARESLGGRLREIRASARVTGRDLAARAGWHFTKVSKLEHGRIMPSEEDLRLWCFHCHALAELAGLLAMRDNTEKMYVELRRLQKAGSAAYQRELRDREARAGSIRSFSAFLVPAVAQTRAYATVRFAQFAEMSGIEPDVASAVDARMERAELLLSGRSLFHLVLCETALTAAMAPPEVMREQLLHLAGLARLRTVEFGVIPLGAPHYPPLCDFWLLDDTAAETETYTAFLRVTQPGEVAVYARVFDSLARSAVHGEQAVEIVERHAAALVQHCATT
ncbi:transcriptional regulator [Acrocarpospora phusangensis]|uniref:Transcriptional regulator n=1 Tax=Acrocarpospora phusangensis TaxID=1070424 RepID=A0A919UQX1_9ACTN|nr:helix-turn-helix transcriptional regulator [Acrocarpospora phusangensis]GIH27347.1 transcriptional regulator [Acrocarpospora phusangensis]